MKTKVLIIDDEISILASLSVLFTGVGYEVFQADSASAALGLLKDRKGLCHNPELILLDVHLPDSNGLILFEEIKKISNDSRVIFMTAFGNVPQAVEAIRKGASDYVLKPFSVDELLFRVSKVLESKSLKEQVNFLSEKSRHDLESKYVFGPNKAMAKIYESLDIIAKSASTTVFIYGETGTGKEIIAQRIHELSERRKKPFVEVNATALTAELLESELFGHEAGSFTGATQTKKGLFEFASGGTLFLDEIGDMDLTMQAKILRALQERKIRRVGGTDFIEVDIRLITATNKNLEEAVSEGTFREDLYYRLNVVPINLPPLRERKDDIESFVRHFIAVFNKEFGRHVQDIAPDALKDLCNYPWPGNVRELRNVIERTLLLECHEGLLKVEHLRFLLGEMISQRISAKPGLPISVSNKIGENFPLESIEREHIEGVLKANSGNKNQAAQILGIDRTTLYNKLKKYSVKSS
ncbi:MAG: DNA-binding NtrC family response regulator [Chlamydiales bacterium]|jgi:DNA-binding NtrC family response regulator